MQEKPRPTEYDHIRLSWNGSRTDQPVLEFLRAGTVVASVPWRRNMESMTLPAAGVINTIADYTVSVL